MARKSTDYTADGAPLFSPLQPLAIDFESLADPNTGRSDDGYMHVSFIRTNVRKFNYKCARLDDTEMEYLVNLVQGKKYTFGYVEFGKKKTMLAYTGKISFEIKKQGYYDNVSFAVIEV